MTVSTRRLRQAALARRFLLALLFAAASLPMLARAADALPSWNEGASKTRIVRFVEDVTKPASRNFVPPAERIAVFDNDGEKLQIVQVRVFQLITSRPPM